MAEELKLKVNTNSDRITRFITNSAKTAKEKRTDSFLKARLKLLDDYWVKFISAYDEYDEAIPATKRAEDEIFNTDIYSLTECAYMEAVSWLSDELGPSPSVPDISVLDTTAVNYQHQSVRLPKIDLPSFSGSYLEWPSFHDTYVSLIHSNCSLSHVQKMHYLKTAITGEASKLLKHLAVTSNNYESAWTSLLDRYNNERVLVNTNLHSLVTLQGMASESPTELRRVLDSFNQSVRALNNLSRPVNTWDDWFVYFLSAKLDRQTRKDWETSLTSSTKVPAFSSLQQFLEGRLHTLSTLRSNDSSFTKRISPPQRYTPPVVRNHYTSSARECSYCERKHLLYSCPRFLSLDINDRIKFIERKALCKNCLRSGHTIESCPSEYRCKHCKQKHHSLLHHVSPASSNPQESNRPFPRPVPEMSTCTHVSSIKCSQPAVLLATAMILIKSPDGRIFKARALLDQGSESNLITHSLAYLLHLPKTKANVSVFGVGQIKVGTVKASVTFTVISMMDPTITYAVHSFVLSKLTYVLPSSPVHSIELSHIHGLQLADPDYDKPAQVDLILGVEFYNSILLGEMRRGPQGSLLAQSTTLGWIVSGPIKNSTVQLKPTSIFLTTSTDVDEFLQKFWEIEQPPAASLLTPEETECENLYQSTHQRDVTGRYVVRLPFKSTDRMLGGSRDAALNALLRMERRFTKDAELYKSYSNFMEEYLRLNHMELVRDETISNSKSYYLPHHAVVKLSSTTTKLRVVFNGSQKTSTGLSLNDLLHVGPKLQNDVMSVLMKWRLFPIVFAADIEKMYRQILVNTADRDFQRILWRSDSSQPIQCFRLRTVTYGTASAPYLACKTLHQLADDSESIHPEAANVIRHNFYVDDALFGAYDEDSARHLRAEVNHLLLKGGFKLRKWLSNTPELLDEVPEQDRERISSVKFVNDAEIKTLGIMWCPSTDTFQFNIQLTDSSISTKRSVLADISRIYDPLGWLSPVSITAKLLLQKLWIARLDWDECLPEDIQTEWNSYKQSLKLLSNLRIHRWLGLNDTQLGLEIHGFSDASLSAYGAAVYLRIIHDHDNVQVTLISAKTRVSPIKTVSLPRLELCGAVLLTELVDHVQRTLNLTTVPVHLWTDSTIVLAWLREHPSKWKVFVANRVAIIQTKLATASWHHIQSVDNPADCITRGIPASELPTFDLWWSSPQWLRKTSNEWPLKSTSPSNSQLQEECRIVCNTITVMDEPKCDLLHKYSSLRRLLRITVYLRRFIHNCQTCSSSRVHGSITLQEIDTALNFWILQVQHSAFNNEHKCLTRKQALPASSKLLSLHPFIDKFQVLRVGGRLKNALIAYDEKHPIILPKDSRLTYLIIHRSHNATLHGGVQATLQHIRSKYWIINGRNQVRQIIRNCVICCRYRASTNAQLMGDLPADRVRPAKPFLVSGVDFAGPLRVKPVKGRGKTIIKSYVALFICFATRAVHIELVMDLSSEAFIAAFRRFVSRRGRCNKLYSDNGRNFVAADKELSYHLKKLLHQSTMGDLLSNEGTDWKFMPPASPHFGGYWEAGIKSLKHHLRRIVGAHTLSIEEITTLLTQIEACLNSRPLTALNDDPQDFSALTPGHFLVGESLLIPPSQPTCDVPMNRLSRWQLVQHMVDQLWQRWAKEYLHNLQVRSKWKSHRTPVKINDLVLLKDENLPPAKWFLCRVTELHPGSDGEIRVVTVRHMNSHYKRAITKLCVLPIDTALDSTNSPL